MQNYFDLTPHLQGPGASDRKEGINNYCAGRYRDQKYKFKQKNFVQKGGEDRGADILAEPPPNMEPNVWNDYVRHYTSESVKSRSTANKACRAKQTITSRHGRTSLAQYRYDNRDPVTQEPGNAIDGYYHMHTRNGMFYQQEAADNYARMMELQAAQVGLETPMTDVQIMEAVLGTRRGWQRGVGPKIRGTSSSFMSSQSKTSQRVYTQNELDDVVAARLAQEREQWQASMMTDMMSQLKSQMQSHTAPLFQALHKGTFPSSQSGPNDEEDGEDGEEEDDGDDFN